MPDSTLSAMPDSGVARPRLVGSVPSCHSAGGGQGAGAGAPVVALVGAPNVGKSTLFNALTGARVTMGNWPGTTVEVSRGRWPATIGDGTRRDLTLVDLPGAYSLDPASPDEALTRALVVDVPDAEAPDVVVVAADAANLVRSLYIVSQLRERELRVVVALTMLDVARHRGVEVDTYALADALGCPVVGVDPRRRAGLESLTSVVLDTLDTPRPAPRVPELDEDADDLAIEDERFAWLEAADEAGRRETGPARRSWTDRVDRWVLAPVAGPLIFLAVMWLVFQVTTTVAAPLQDLLDRFFSGVLSDGIRAGLAAMGLGGGWVEGLLVDGLVAGVGMLLTFVPLMALMFVLLAMLEDSGYMARAAVVTDRLMRMIGLPGRAFLPLIVGFGCNVPAIAATRILPSARQRILTVLLVPFTSCSARLTVYVLLATTFFGAGHAGTVVFIMYVVSILLVVVTGLLLRRTLWRTMGADPLVIDLPAYQAPTVRLTAAVTRQRLRGFLQTASGIIVATVCAVWLLQSIPAHGGQFGEVPVQDSVYGVASQAVAPAFAPAGFGHWQSASALVVGFVAKEAVISSWAQTYAVEEPGDSGPGELGEKITATFEESSGGHPLPAVAAFMVFLLAYTPCVATLAAQRREVGLRWTLFGLVTQLAVAWVAAVAVFQIGRVFW